MNRHTPFRTTVCLLPRRLLRQPRANPPTAQAELAGPASKFASWRVAGHPPKPAQANHTNLSDRLSQSVRYSWYDLAVPPWETAALGIDAGGLLGGPDGRSGWARVTKLGATGKGVGPRGKPMLVRCVHAARPRINTGS